MESRPILDESPLSTKQMILWWELRRFPFNGLLLIIGILSILGIEIITLPYLRIGEDADPTFLVLGIALYGFMANICYTAGWILELWFRQHDSLIARRRGLWMFRTGLLFSCALTTLPFWFACAWRFSHFITPRIR